MKLIVLAMFLNIKVSALSWDFNLNIRQYYNKAQSLVFCNDFWISPNFRELKINLGTTVTGQPFLSQLVPALKKHYDIEIPEKPLILNFYGPSGVGKNYVADLIVNHIYRTGYSAGMVLSIIPKNIHSSTEINSYRDELNSTIYDFLSKCERSIIIFDDMEKMLPEVLYGLTLFTSPTKFFDTDYRRAVFIFISNIGGNEVIAKTKKLLSIGRQRETFDVEEFKEAYIQGYVAKSFPASFLKQNFIYVPFLPLEAQHIKQCIHFESERLDVKPHETMVKKILDDTQFTADKFSSRGCKEVAKQFVIELGHSYSKKNEL